MHLELRISPRIFEKTALMAINGILRGLGELIHEKNMKLKIPWPLSLNRYTVCTYMYHISYKFDEDFLQKEAYPVAIVQDSFVVEVKVKTGIARNVHIHAPLVLLGIIKLKQKMIVFTVFKL